MTRLGARLAGVAVVVTGCTYYNAVYNAERLYGEAEDHARAGRDSLAQLGYREVVRRTAEAYRASPGGERAGELLLLLGRAHLRTGEVRAARLALEEALGVVGEPVLRARILIELGHALLREGDETAAHARAEEALALGVVDPLRSEALLLRGSARLARAPDENGWADLERAGEDDAVRVSADLARLRWSVRHGDPEHARSALDRLLATRAAASSVDTVAALVDALSERWSPSVAATFLGGVDSSRWAPAARGRVALQRARLLYQAGDTAAATDLAGRVTAGRDAAAAEARLQLARWLLDRTPDLGATQAARTLLLPAGDHPSVSELLAALDQVDRYASLGLEEPAAWFLAAEVARDRLGAAGLARGFFLAYADSEPSEPWAGKALLAALAVSPWEDDRAWLRGRLEAYRHSPYVLAARGVSAEGVEALDQELQVRLSEIRSR